MAPMGDRLTTRPGEDGVASRFGLQGVGFNFPTPLELMNLKM